MQTELKEIISEFLWIAADTVKKREETLKGLAERISEKALKTGKSTVLEPMNPYERRIIHSVVSKIEGVNSKSIGEEPYRKNCYSFG